jgi:hypothetical protein
MSTLPQKLPLPLMQTKWASVLEPILQNPLTQGQLLTGIKLINGSNVINHGLGRELTGWIICGITAAAAVYDTQASNPRPNLTLQLTSNAAATASLYVF